MEDSFLYTDSWKNKEVFKNQLELNQQQLNDQYPVHWNHFIDILLHLKTSNLLDIGCGVGEICDICSKRFLNYPDNVPTCNECLQNPSIRRQRSRNSTPIAFLFEDYSEEAINIAQEHWPSHTWYVKDYNQITPDFVKAYDTIHAGAFLDVLPNGDEVLRLLLGLDVKNVFIGRAKITEKPSYFETYTAYNKITTYAYHHNINNLKNLAEVNGYSLSFLGVQEQCNLIFQKNL